MLGVSSLGRPFPSTSLLSAFTKFGLPGDEGEERRLRRVATATLVLLLLERAGVVVREEAAGVGRVVGDLLASLPCNTHGAGEMVLVRVGEHRCTGEVRPVGRALYPTLSLANHACCPNLARITLQGATVAAVAGRAIRWVAVKGRGESEGEGEGEGEGAG